MMRTRTFPFPFPCTAQDICRKRAFILSSLCRIDQEFAQIPASHIQSSTLKTMLSLYDEQFFCGCLHQLLGQLQVTLSSRMTSSAGKFIYVSGMLRRIKQAEIRMSSDFLLRLENGPFTLNGLSVSTPQEAFLLVFEHELCHAFEMAWYGQTGHSSRFLGIAKGLFGHTATRHSLPTRKQDAEKNGLRIGSRVSFDYRDQHLSGTVTYIGKSITVMVPSSQGTYRDRFGRRYAKYHVPVARIQMQ